MKAIALIPRVITHLFCVKMCCQNTALQKDLQNPGDSRVRPERVKLATLFFSPLSFSLRKWKIAQATCILELMKFVVCSCTHSTFPCVRMQVPTSNRNFHFTSQAQWHLLMRYYPWSSLLGSECHRLLNELFFFILF